MYTMILNTVSVGIEAKSGGSEDKQINECCWIGVKSGKKK